MFAGNGSQQVVAQRASDICRSLRDDLDRARNFYQWLSAQSNEELAAVGFSDQDITFMRSAFADLMALAVITNGGMPPASYPQPAQGYDYTVNAKQLAGPQ